MGTLVAVGGRYGAIGTAGRFVDLLFPNYPDADFRINTAGPPTSIYNRITGLAQGSIAVVLTSANYGWNVSLPNGVFGLGAATINMGASAANSPNGSEIHCDGFTFCPIIYGGGPSGNTPIIRPRVGAWRFRSVLSLAGSNAATPANVDFGTFILTAGSVTKDAAAFFQLGTPGFGIQCVNKDTISFVCRATQGAGITTVPLLSPALGYTSGDFHQYDLVVINAQGKQNAQLKVYVDNILVHTRFWDTAQAQMPFSQGVSYGFRPTVIMNGGSAQSIQLLSLELHGAETEAQLG